MILLENIILTYLIYHKINLNEYLDNNLSYYFNSLKYYFLSFSTIK